MFLSVPVVGVVAEVKYTCLRSMLSKSVEKHELGKYDSLQIWGLFVNTVVPISHV